MQLLKNISLQFIVCGQDPKYRGETDIGNLIWKGTKIAKRPYKQGPYRIQEITVLKKKYPDVSAVALAATLKRSLISVQKELRELGISRRTEPSWTHAELRRLRSSYKETATWELANKLDKTPSEIKRKAADLGLKK